MRIGRAEKVFEYSKLIRASHWPGFEKYPWVGGEHSCHLAIGLPCCDHSQPEITGRCPFFYILTRSGCLAILYCTPQIYEAYVKPLRSLFSSTCNDANFFYLWVTDLIQLVRKFGRHLERDYPRYVILSCYFSPRRSMTLGLIRPS